MTEPTDPDARAAIQPDPRVVSLRGALLDLVRRDGRDLTVRQLTAFLSVYMDPTTYTVSRIADLLHISRPGATRLLDRLIDIGLVARDDDREDRRRVLVRRTPRGLTFFRELVSATGAVPAEPDAAAA